MDVWFISLFFVLGAVLLILEIFVPGGILGGIGIVALITGVALTANSLVEALLYIMGMLVLLLVLVVLSFRFPATRRIWERFSLKTRQTNQEGFLAPKISNEKFLGRSGMALTHLRPAGTADFDGERVDVVTEGSYIKAGVKIKVIVVEGGRIIVREE